MGDCIRKKQGYTIGMNILQHNC